MTTKTRIGILISLGALLWSPSVLFAQTATLALSPSTGSFPMGKTFSIGVAVDSGSTAINSANATLTFDSTVLAVDSISKTGSAFGLWAVDPSFSNTAGTINFEGGNTSPVSGKKQLLTIVFKPLKEGSAQIGWKDGSVLAADGKGTNIVGDKLPSTYTITPPGTAPPPVSSTQGSVGPAPDAPEVTSTSHADPNVWYATTSASFSWDNPIDVTAVRLVLDQSDKTVPLTTIDPAVSDHTVDNVKPGVNWFHVRLKSPAGWGATAHRQVLVDSTPPEEFTVTVTPDASAPDIALVKFSATDTLSGVDRYEISTETGEVRKLKVTDVPEAGYAFTGLSAGSHTLKVVVYDKAGNKRDASGTVSVLGPPVVVANAGEDLPPPSVFTGQYILSMVLAAMLAFLIGFLIYERRVVAHERRQAKREADEVREKLETIFSVLRQEIEEQVNLLAQKPNASAQDREVQERLREALDISEELIDKEVEDVRKLLS